MDDLEDPASRSYKDSKELYPLEKSVEVRTSGFRIFQIPTDSANTLWGGILAMRDMMPLLFNSTITVYVFTSKFCRGIDKMKVRVAHFADYSLLVHLVIGIAALEPP